MSDLISRSELLESFRKSYCGHLGMENSDGMMTFRSICRIINEQPTAYDIDKIVEELDGIKGFICSRNNCSKCEYTTYCFYGEQSHKVAIDKAIEIVKHSGVRNNRKDCEYRHDNGNCLKVGGFCTAVDDKHCEKIKQDGVTDDVCEWKQTSTAKYKTSCGYKLEEYFDTKACYCKQCGKKIKVVE